MITEQELKDKCTTEFIKWMCELAEGFRISERYIYPLVKSTCINYNGWCAETTENFVDTVFSFALFPLLIHRAVEGWNKINICRPIQILCNCISFITDEDEPASIEYGYDNDQYQPESLTHAECAILNCLLDVFKQEERDE